MMRLLREGSKGVAIVNALWLFSERVALLVLTLLVSIAMARYLGPAAFGELNYAIALVTLMGVLTYLGFGGVVVKELVIKPEEANETLGTVFALKLLGAGLALVGLLLVIGFDPPSRQSTLLLIIAVSLLFDAMLVIRLFFESKVASKRVVVATTTATVLASLGRLAAVAAGAPLWAFAAAHTAQSALTALGMWIVYSLAGEGMSRWRFSARRGCGLLRTSWPLMLSSAGALLYLKIDQVMLGEMVGKQAVGIYAVAARLAEVWFFIPGILAASIFPRLLQLRAIDVPLYQFRMQEALRYMVWISLAIAIPVSIVSTPLIMLLYGAEYCEAGAILAVYIWTCPTVFMGAVLSKWLIAEDLLIFSVTRHLFGAAANIGLNLLLIPIWGGFGSALATLVSYTIASYLACFTDRRTFEMGRWMTSALISPVMVPLRKLGDLNAGR